VDLFRGIDLCFDRRAGLTLGQSGQFLLKLRLPDFPHQKEIPIPILLGLHELLRGEGGIQFCERSECVLVHRTNHRNGLGPECKTGQVASGASSRGRGPVQCRAKANVFDSWGYLASTQSRRTLSIACTHSCGSTQDWRGPIAHGPLWSNVEFSPSQDRQTILGFLDQ